MNFFFNAEKQLRAGWKCLLFIVVFILLTILFAFLTRSFLSPENRMLLMIITVPLSSWLMLRFVDKLPLKAIGLLTGELPRTALKDISIGFLAGALAMCVIALFLSFMNGFSFQLNPEIQYSAILSFILMMIAVGIYEELLLRGYLLRVLTKGLRFGKMSLQQSLALSIFLTSVLFGVMHLGNPNANWVSAANIALAGLMLAIPIVITGRMYASMALHFSWNWFQGGVFGMPVSGSSLGEGIFTYSYDSFETLFSGGAFGPEAGLVGILGMFIAILPFYIVYKRQNGSLRIFETQYVPYESNAVQTDSNL